MQPAPRLPASLAPVPIDRGRHGWRRVLSVITGIPVILVASLLLVVGVLGLAGSMLAGNSTAASSNVVRVVDIPVVRTEIANELVSNVSTKNPKLRGVVTADRARLVSSIKSTLSSPAMTSAVTAVVAQAYQAAAGTGGEVSTARVTSLFLAGWNRINRRLTTKIALPTNTRAVHIKGIAYLGTLKNLRLIAAATLALGWALALLGTWLISRRRMALRLILISCSLAFAGAVGGSRLQRLHINTHNQSVLTNAVVHASASLFGNALLLSSLVTAAGGLVLASAVWLVGHRGARQITT